MELKDELPLDHELAQVYRGGAAFCGVVLLVFGCLGLADQLSPFDTNGSQIAGMSTNGALSLISVVVGLALVAGGVIGGNFASTLNMGVGTLFLTSRFVHVFILDKGCECARFRHDQRHLQFRDGAGHLDVRHVRACVQPPAARQPLLAQAPSAGSGGRGCRRSGPACGQPHRHRAERGLQGPRRRI